MTANKKRILEIFTIFGLLYVGLFVFFHYSGEKSQWITDHWRISSKEDPFLYPVFPILSIVLVLVGMWLGLWLACQMLISDYRRLWFGGFFGLLGGTGFSIWATVLTPVEKFDTWYIPLIGGGLILLGLLLLLFFKPRKTGKR